MQVVRISRPSTLSAGRDAMCMAVEQQLLKLATGEKDGLRMSAAPGGPVTATFGNLRVQGESRDIAVLRLASVLLDHPRYAQRLTRGLRTVAAASTWKND